MGNSDGRGGREFWKAGFIWLERPSCAAFGFLGVRPAEVVWGWRALPNGD